MAKSKSTADQNMIECNTEQAARLLQVAFLAKRPVMLWGSPGIGKSGLLKTIAKAQNRHLIDYRLLLKDLSDMKGIPYYNQSKDALEMFYDPTLPNEAIDNPRLNNSILVFEELNAAPPTIQAATYQIILDRYCGNLKIPDGVDIVACGNLETDKGVTFNMPTPLRNRLLHILVRVDSEAWENWAFGAKIHKHVLSYVMANKSRLYQFDPSTGEKAFATPRTWEYVSDLLYAAEKMGMTLDKNREEVRNLIGSAVGEGTAIELLRHITVAAKLPRIGDILSGKVKAIPKGLDDISAHYSLGIEMIYAFNTLAEECGNSDTKKNNLDTEFENAFVFMESGFSEELTFMTLTKMLNDGEVLCYITLDDTTSPAFGRFMEKFSKLVNINR